MTVKKKKTMTPSKETNDFPTVSLGASASGMGALETFLSHMLLTAEWDLSSSGF